MINIGFNLWAFASLIIFWITMAGTQAWIWRSWFEQPIWLWIGINFGALLAALLISVSTVYVFQDTLNIFLVILTAILAFGATLSLIQWLVLRQQVILPVLWSVANVIIGLFAWVLLEIFFSFTLYHNNWRFLVLSIVAGATVGVASSTLINTWGRP